MSHYIYKDKKFLEINGKILPLILYADSSVTEGYSRKHPAHWFIDTLSAEPALLIDKELYQKAANEKVQSRIDWLKKNYPDSNPDLDSYNPFGDTYRGNGKLRGMKSFLSCKRTVSAEDFLRREAFSVRLEPCDKHYKKLEGYEKRYSFYITSTEDIIHMDEWYRELRKLNPEALICISVHGLLTD